MKTVDSPELIPPHEDRVFREAVLAWARMKLSSLLSEILKGSFILRQQYLQMREVMILLLASAHVVLPVAAPGRARQGH